ALPATLDQFNQDWYPRPIPPDLQYEERNVSNRFSVSSGKLYEWNIDGLSEQEILNKIQHIAMVANNYLNEGKTHPEVIDLIVLGITGKLLQWWNNCLTENSKEDIRTAVQKNEEGLPIFEDPPGRGIPDGVNTLIYTIINHFVGKPSNITSRIYDQLSNLRCRTLGDYRCLTYGDISSTIRSAGMKMCRDFKIHSKASKSKAKYELGTFCTQYGLPPIAPSKKKSKHRRPESPEKTYRKRINARYYRKQSYNNPKDGDYYKKGKPSRSKSTGKYEKIPKASGKCFSCGKRGHFRNECKDEAKTLINTLINDQPSKDKIFKLLELDHIEHESTNSSSDHEFYQPSSEPSRNSSSSSEPQINLASYILHNNDLFQRTLKILKTHLQSLEERNNHITSLLFGREEIRSKDKTVLIGTCFARLSLKTQASVGSVFANLPSEIQVPILGSKVMSESLDLWFRHFRVLITTRYYDPDDPDLDYTTNLNYTAENALTVSRWEAYFGSSLKVYEKEKHPFLGLLINYNDLLEDEEEDNQMNPHWLSQMFEYGFTRLIRLTSHNQVGQLPSIIKDTVTRVSSPYVTIRCWSTIPEWKMNEWATIQPSKHLVLIGGYSHQGP
ncbi:hypothetical protein SO802_017773, partial [Lithocarpus litseifolius]